jgi:arrestin-related trafficking adapter 3/6
MTSHNNSTAKTQRKALSIRLSESAVYLRTDGQGRRSSRDDPRGSLLRGLLVLELSKATKITSIELELTATTCNAWPEGERHLSSITSTLTSVCRIRRKKSGGQ